MSMDQYRLLSSTATSNYLDLYGKVQQGHAWLAGQHFPIEVDSERQTRAIRKREPMLARLFRKLRGDSGLHVVERDDGDAESADKIHHRLHRAAMLDDLLEKLSVIEGGEGSGADHRLNGLRSRLRKKESEKRG